MVLLTLVGFTVLYGGLAVIEVGLLTKRIGAAFRAPRPRRPATPTDKPMTFAY